MKRTKERLKLIRPLLVPLIFYIGLLAVSYTRLDPAQTLANKVFLTILPMIPAIFLAFGFVKAVSKLDELERKIILEASAFSLIITILGMIALMLLSQAGVTAPNPGFIGLAMAILLLIGKIAGNWRHK